MPELEGIKLDEILPGQAVELGKVEYSKATANVEAVPVEVLQKATVEIARKLYTRKYLDEARARLVEELANIDALIVEADKLGL